MKDFTILSIELVDYLRLKPNGIYRIVITMDNLYQIIIGTNGSGKSSILRQLTPLPADTKEFGPNGLKDLRVLANNVYYRLINDFKNKHHNFMITDADGNMLEELNPSGNVTTQRKLASEYFGYDNELAAVILGDHDFKFTRMSANRRKEWMLRLGNTNLDYALGLHKKVKARLNETIAVTKHLKRRIGEESIARISDEEIAELSRKVSVLNDRLTELLTAKIPDVMNPEAIRYRVFNLLRELDTSMTSVIKPTTIEKSGFNFKGQESPASALYTLRARNETISALQSQIAKDIDVKYAESAKIKQVISTMLNNAMKSVDDLRIERDLLIARREALRSSIILNIVPSNVDMALDTRDTFKIDINELLMHLSENRNNYYNRQTYNTKLEEIRNYEVKVMDIDRHIGRLDHQISHMEKNDITVCPNCNHKWFPMIGATLEQVKAEHRTHSDNRIHYIEEINFAKSYCADFDERRTILIGINDMAKRIEHKPFIDFLFSITYWDLAAPVISQYVSQWYADCATHRDIHATTQALDVLDSAITTASTIGPDELTSERIAEIDVQINALLEQQDVLALEFKSNASDIDELMTMNTAFERGKAIVNEIVDLFDELSKAGVNEYIRIESASAHSDLSYTQTALNAAEAVSAIIASLEKDMAKATTDVKILELLESELSPTRGVIAEHISGFINVFVQQMNNVIRQVWNQRLEILPCGFDEESGEGELDYKFPLITGLETAADVGRGSTAQRDMVDFAFILVTYLYLGMDRYPLYIDELAPTMDDLHRVRITQYVKQLMDTNQHSQMFMISHYISGHGVFSGADYCLLSDTNIMHKPKEYNKHVVIE